MQPLLNEERVNDLVHQCDLLTQRVGQLEKRLDKCVNVLQAVFELVRTDMRLEPAALAAMLAAVLREKAEKAQALCTKCNRPLGEKKKCLYCGTERKAESIFDNL